jgi:hypothetical protein
VAEIPKESRMLKTIATSMPIESLVVAKIHTPPSKLSAAQTAKMTKKT